MRVCILMGSLRPDRNTAELCKPFMDELLQHEAAVEYITLYDKRIAPCRGCYSCQSVVDAYGCVQQDDMQAIVESILKADVLVFATPVYTWQATPPMKAVMDRMYGLNKFYGSAPCAVLNLGQAYALIVTCGYDLDFERDYWMKVYGDGAGIPACHISECMPFATKIIWRRSKPNLPSPEQGRLH